MLETTADIITITWINGIEKDWMPYRIIMVKRNRNAFIRKRMITASQ
jgi:hypothetical protein